MKKMNKIFTALMMVLLVLVTVKGALGDDSPYKGTVFINEFLDGSEQGVKDWVEIYNDGDTEIPLTGWMLKDEVGNKASFPDGAVVASKGFYALDFNQLNLDGDTINLIDNNLDVVDVVKYPEGDIPNPGKDESTGRYLDGSDNWYVFLKTTPGAENIIYSGETSQSEEDGEVYNDGEISLKVTLSRNTEDKKINEIIDTTTIDLMIDDNFDGVFEAGVDWTREMDSCSVSDSEISCSYEVTSEELKEFAREEELWWAHVFDNILSSEWEGVGDKNFTVKNRAPKLVNPDYAKERTAVEGVPLADTWDDDLKFMDEDGDTLSYSWEENPGLEIDNNGEITWDNPVKDPAKEKYENIKLIANDNQPKNNIGEAVFNLTVKPFLEVTKIEIKKGETTVLVKEGEEISWHDLQLEPGSKYHLTVEVANNGDYNIEDVHVALSGLNSDDKNIGTLEKNGGSQQHTFEEEVPNKDEGAYEIKITASSEEVFTKEKKDEFSFKVNVRKIVGEVRINEDKTKWEQDKSETYCDQWLKLDGEIENIGINPKDITVFLRDDDAEKTVLAQEDILDLQPGDKTPVSLEFNISELEEREHTLTLELINGFGDTEDVETVTIHKHGCFDAPVPIKEIWEGETEEIELKNYLKDGIEDTEKDSVIYSPDVLVAEPNIISCSWTDQNKGKLECTANDDDSGTATLDLTLTAPSAVVLGENTPNEEHINILVKPTINIIDVSVKETSIEKEGTSPAISPEEEYTIKFKVTNNFNEKLSNLHVKLDDKAQGLFCGKNQNKKIISSLAPGETSSEIVLNEKLCSGITEKLYEDIKLIVWGLDEETQVRDGSFPFNLKVLQTPTQVKLSTDWEENETYCDQWLRLTVNYENLGDTSSFSVTKISLEDETGTILKEIDNPEVFTLDFSTESLTESEQPYLLTVKLEYEATVNGYVEPGTIEKTVKVTEHGCPLEVTEFESLYEGEEAGKSVNLLEKLNIPDEEKTGISFSLEPQTSEELKIAGCNIDKLNVNELTCKPEDNNPGEFNLKVKAIAEAKIDPTLKPTENENEIKVKVKPTLEILNLKINGEPVNKEGPSPTIHPLEGYLVEFEVKNNLGYELKNIHAGLDDAGAGLGFNEEKIVIGSLGPGEATTEPIKLTEKLLPGILETDYDVSLDVWTTQNDVLRDDSFPFRLIVKQKYSKVEITELKWADDSMGNDKDYTYCDQWLKLDVSYKDMGDTLAQKVEVSLKDKDGNVLVSELGNAGSATLIFSTKEPVDLSEGKHTLTVRLSYEIEINGKTSKEWTESQVEVTKHGCLLEVTEFESLYEGEDKDEEIVKINLLEKLNIPDEEKTKITEFTISQTEDEKEIAGCELQNDDGDKISESLTCTPTKDKPGEFNLKVKAIAEAKIDPKIDPTLEPTENENEIKVGVKPTLEITEVKIKEKLIEEDTGVSLGIYPEKEYTVNFKVKNHLDHPLSKVYAKLVDLDADDGLGFSSGKKVLESLEADTESGELSLTEILPNKASDKEYKVKLVVESMGGDYRDDSFGFFLKVNKEKESVEITDVRWFPNQLNLPEDIPKNEVWCNQNLLLKVGYENFGWETAKGINLFLEDEKGEEIMGTQKDLGDLESKTPGKNPTISFNVQDIKDEDFKEETPYTLTVKLSYEVNDFAVEKTETVEIKKHDCFAPEDPVLILYEGESAETVDLKEFTPSSDWETIDYALGTQTNPDLVSCVLPVDEELTCTPNTIDLSGTSTLDITLTTGDTVNEESINIEVKPTIKISKVEIKGEEVEEGEESKAVTPLTEFPVKVTLTNHWDKKITYAKIDFKDAGVLGLEGKEFGGLELVPGGSVTLELPQTIEKPFSGKVPDEEIRVRAKDENNYPLGDSYFDDTFIFDLNVGQTAGSDIKITGAKLDKDETYCSQNLILEVEYANAGLNPEDKIKLVVKEGDKVLKEVEGLNLGSGGSDIKNVPFSTLELSKGEEAHALTVELTSETGEKLYTYPETLKVVKHGCISIPEEKLTLTEEESGLPDKGLNLNDYLLDEKEIGSVTFKLGEQSGLKLIACQVISGIVHCPATGSVWPTPAAESLNEGGLDTTNLGLTITAADGTENKETISVKVTGVNDAPKFLREFGVSFDEDESKTIKLSDFADDVDNEFSELSFSWEGNEKVKLAQEGENLIFSAEKDWYGTEEFKITVSDGKLSDSKTAIVKVKSVDDPAGFTEEEFPDEEVPEGEKIGPILDGKDYELKVNVKNPDKKATEMKWLVDGKEEKSERNNKEKFTSKFTFNEAKAGEYKVEVILLQEGAEPQSGGIWSITVVDRPVDLKEFGYTEEITEPSQVESFTLANQYGKIEFKEAVDLSEILELGKVVKLKEGLVAVDSEKAAGLNKAAKITFYNLGLTEPLVMKTSEFTDDKSLAREVTDIEVTLDGGKAIFEVSGFSTYVIVEKIPTELKVPAEIVFELAELGATVEKTFTVENTGTVESLSGITLSSKADSKYGVVIEPSTLSLAAGEQKEVKVTAKVPEDESGGKKKIGEITFAYGDNKSRTVPLYIQTKSLLEITSIELNGKSNGEFKLGEENELEVEVKNNGAAEIKDVVIVVRVKDIDDGEDWDEESDEFDLEGGEDNKESFNFNVGSDLTEKDYQVKIQIERDGKVVTEESRSFDVEREKHKIIIDEVELPEMIYCNKYPTLRVGVKNVGESSEDEVVIKVRSESLGMEMEKAGIELGDYSDSDNDYRASFPLDLSEAAEGEHSIIIEAYRDEDKLEESKTVSLTVGECLSTTKAEVTAETLAEDIAAEIEQQLPPVVATQPTTTVKASFRESDTYLVLLAIIVGLAFVAVVVGFTSLLVRRR